MGTLQRLRPALAACRRIVLLLVLCASLLATWVYWRAPSLDELRPELEALLRQELSLKQLQLDRLSWYWAGSTWVHAQSVSLVTEDDRVRVSKARLAVRISTWGLITGRVIPASVNIRGGLIELDIPEVKQAGLLSFPDLLLIIEDTELAWRHGKTSGNIEKLNIHLDGVNRRLSVQVPGSRIKIAFDEDLKLTSVYARFEDIRWLPEQFRRHIKGRMGGDISLQREENNFWQLQLGLLATEKTEIMDDKGSLQFAFESIHAMARIQMDDDAGKLYDVRFDRLSWRLGENMLAGKGRWREGMLNLILQSGALQMPVLWSWLKPIGDDEWQQWLAQMKEGTARDLQGALDIAWRSTYTLPSDRDWQQARYRFAANISNADIALAIGGDRLRQVGGHVDVTEKGLLAHISQADLPDQSGRVQGTVAIHGWEDPLLNIKGKCKVDMGLLQTWLDIHTLHKLKFGPSPADGKFSLIWMPGEDEPRSGSALLRPVDAWQAEILGIRLALRGGKLRWDSKKGVRASDMRFYTSLAEGSFSMQADRGTENVWSLTSMSARAVGNFALLVEKLQLPVQGAGGDFQIKAGFDGNWHGSIDFSNALWDHFLGSSKNPGVTYKLHATGSEKNGALVLQRLLSEGKTLYVMGNGVINQEKLVLHLKKIFTPAFNGSMRLTAPFADYPLELFMDLEFLDRGFLPDVLPKRIEAGRPWALKAKIKRLTWGAAEMQHVNLSFASAAKRVGSLRAQHLKTAKMTISNVKARFGLTGSGVVDLRQLAAEMLGQRLMLSATLQIKRGGGLLWHGFAQLSGDFSRILRRMDITQRFQGGQLHALISGKGLLLADKPWWHELKARLRLRADDGRILEGGTLTRLLAAASLADLPRLLVGQRKDLVGPGMHYRRLQLEAAISGKQTMIHKLAIRSSALDMVGNGKMDLEVGNIDLIMIIRPLQNLDALLGAIPLLRDLLGGAAHSLMRKVYHVHGPLSNAAVEQIEPEKVGLARPGLIESLLKLPGKWFGKEAQPAK